MPITITADCFNNRPDYSYGRYLGKALPQLTVSLGIGRNSEISPLVHRIRYIYICYGEDVKISANATV